jgi:hypothetical protein
MKDHNHILAIGVADYNAAQVRLETGGPSRKNLCYITRVQERHEVRSRLYHKTVELLHGKQAAREAT